MGLQHNQVGWFEISVLDMKHAVDFYGYDIENACKKAGEKGGHVQQEKSSIGEYGFVAMLCDTERNAIGIHSRT